MVYHPKMSVMDSIGYYISQFCLSWTIIVGISAGFDCLLWTINVGISTGFVCHGQNWLVFHPVLSVVDKIGWNINFYLSWTIIVGISPSFVCHEKHWPSFVCHGQYNLVHIPVLSVMNKMIGISPVFFLSFLSWTKLVGKSTGFVCRGQ